MPRTVEQHRHGSQHGCCAAMIHVFVLCVAKVVNKMLVLNDTTVAKQHQLLVRRLNIL